MWKSLLFALIGGVSQYATQAITSSVSGTGKIDWSHIGSACAVGALTTVAGLWHPSPSQDQQK